MKRRALPLILAILLLAGGTAHALAPVRTYQDQFTDVPAGAWYYDNVRSLYELGLTNGHGREDCFAPASDITVAEALAMAARLRSLYDWGDGEAGPAAFAGETWYGPYVGIRGKARRFIGKLLSSCPPRQGTSMSMSSRVRGRL